jgi:hypothetical protein
MDALRHGAAQVFHGHWLLRFPRKPHNTALLTNSRCSLHERAVPMVWPAFCPVVFLTCRDWFFTFCAFHIRYLSLRSVSRSTGCGSAFFVRPLVCRAGHVSCRSGQAHSTPDGRIEPHRFDRRQFRRLARALFLRHRSCRTQGISCRVLQGSVQRFSPVA